MNLLGSFAHGPKIVAELLEPRNPIAFVERVAGAIADSLGRRGHLARDDTNRKYVKFSTHG
ncbi:MAG: hypothetical protein AAGH92_13055 [Planctomycetota bacterium]